MVTDTDSLYDSLEEGNSGSGSEYEDSREEAVPFYNKEVKKNHLIQSKQISKIPRRRVFVEPIILKDNTKSYLRLFYQRKGYMPDKDLGRSSLNLSSERAYETCEESEVRSLLDSDSGTSQSLSEGFKEGAARKERNSGFSGSQTSTSLQSRLCSVSEQFMGSDIVMSPVRKFCQKAAYVSVPSLGGLGANIQIDKLEQLRKRQEYGLRVSEKNRLKLLEKKTIKQLSKELNSNSVSVKH